jgi:hypothetical protein
MTNKHQEGISLLGTHNMNVKVLDPNDAVR